MEDSHAETLRRTSCRSIEAGWNGPIDVHLKAFLDSLGKFFEWFSNHYPRRREETHSALTRLDASHRQLPPPLAELNVDTWEEIDDYFQSVAHHRRPADEAEFRQWLEAMERFLLERMVPRTFEDFAEIDAMLEEKDRDA
jgi:hypothetical protein